MRLLLCDVRLLLVVHCLVGLLWATPPQIAQSTDNFRSRIVNRTEKPSARRGWVLLLFRIVFALVFRVPSDESLLLLLIRGSNIFVVIFWLRARLILIKTGKFTSCHRICFFFDHFCNQLLISSFFVLHIYVCVLLGSLRNRLGKRWLTKNGLKLWLS